jgi:hypothetical protein
MRTAPARRASFDCWRGQLYQLIPLTVVDLDDRPAVAALSEFGYAGD